MFELISFTKSKESIAYIPLLFSRSLIHITITSGCRCRILDRLSIQLIHGIEDAWRWIISWRHVEKIDLRNIPRRLFMDTVVVSSLRERNEYMILIDLFEYAIRAEVKTNNPTDREIFHDII